jgi:hypothetical protein
MEVDPLRDQQLVCVFAPKGRRIIAQGEAGFPAKPWVYCETRNTKHETRNTKHQTPNTKH